MKEYEGVLSSKESYMVEKLLRDTLPYSVGLVIRLARLLPDGPCSVVPWQGRPSDGSADLVLWRLAALLKHDEETRHMDPEAHWPMVMMISEHLGIDDDDGWRLFSSSFAKAKQGLGAANDALQTAKHRAETAIQNSGDSVITSFRPYYRDKRRRLLVCVMFYLLNDGSPVGTRYLSTRDAGTLIGVDASTAAIWIKAMVRDGYLEKIATGNEYRAARYRWINSSDMNRLS